MSTFDLKSEIQKCPFLRGNYISSCKITDKPYVPSLFENEEYCNSVRHSMCPFFLKHYRWNYTHPTIRKRVG